jgi:hypothetical protein
MTAPTQAQIAAGAAAAEKYEGWEAGFIGQTYNEKMVGVVFAAATGSADQSAAGRQAAAVSALTKIVDAAGYGSEVSGSMISGVVAAVLSAV